MSLVLLLVFLASLVSRILVSYKAPISFDAYGHLLFAKVLHQQRRGPFSAISMNVVGASPFSQPFMWNWLVGFIAPKALLRNQAWLNGGLDSLFVVAAFLIALRGGFSERVVLYAIAIYLMTPMWFSSIAIGPRIAGFTPRLSSEVVTNLFFMVCLLPLGLSELQIFIIGGVLAAFVLSSSKFGVQALIFLVPIASLISSSLLPLLSFLIGVFVTVLVSRGRVISQLRSQVMHLAWYYKENLKGRMHVSNRNSFRTLFDRSDLSLKHYVAKLIHRIVSENSYTSVLVKLPVIFLAIIPVSHLFITRADDYASALAAPTMAACVVYFVVNLRPFLFLGEAERYLNHVAIFIALVAAKYALDNRLEWVLWLLCIYGAVYWLTETFVLEKLKPHHVRARVIDDDLVIKDLQGLNRPTVVLAYPYQAAGGVFRILLETRHRAVFCFFTAKDFTESYNERYSGGYPYVKLERLDAMAAEYGIGYLILDRKSLAARGFGAWVPSSQWVRRPVGGESYDIYMRQEAAEARDMPSVAVI